MIALDASALIAYLDGSDAHHERAQRALLGNAGEPFCASVVTLAEVLVGPARAGDARRIRGVIAELGVEPVPVNASDDLALAELRVRTGLKLPDCCALLAAAATGARMLSFDARLRRAAGEEGLRSLEA